MCALVHGFTSLLTARSITLLFLFLLTGVDAYGHMRQSVTTIYVQR